MLKFIPVRGRKQIRGKGVLAVLTVEIYPREGTETQTAHCPVHLAISLKFIPVRGRKRMTTFDFASQICVEIYPREGTETTVMLPFRNLAQG